MPDQHAILVAIVPVIVLLALGIVSAVGSRLIGLNPVVGYLLLGFAFDVGGVSLVANNGTVALLAQLGVVFLLFDVGLHFSLQQVRRQARDIFGFGPVQVVFAALLLGATATFFGLSGRAAFIVGTTLSLSSTAVVAGLIAERHQQNCPVGLTATSILIFQDLAAIVLLVVAESLGEGQPVVHALALGLGKAVLAFAAALSLARIVIRPVFAFVGRGRNEEVFTAMALVVALGAAWATGASGLSLTLGAFLAGMVIAETPFRAIIKAEIKPFRGLLLGFFFISVGMSLDVPQLRRLWPGVLIVTTLLLSSKIVSNALAGRTFRWSVPGTVQLAFLLAQGSEFAFVILALPSVRELVGADAATVLICAVALSLSVTPTLAQTGRTLAGRIRSRNIVQAAAELEEQTPAGPVFIAGMGHVGRAIADTLTEFGVDYASIERDNIRLREAIADGYKTVFGDFADPRIWDTLSLANRRICVLTAPRFEVYRELATTRTPFFPDLVKVAVVQTQVDIARFETVDVIAIIDRSIPKGLDLAALVLGLLGTDPVKVGEWMRDRQETALSDLKAPVMALLTEGQST